MRFNDVMTIPALTRLTESGAGTKRTFRHPSGVVAGTLGPLYLAIRAVLESDPDIKWLWLAGAVVVAWAGWTQRMTLRTDGIIVQNCWIPKRYPWEDIRTARMTQPRFWDPVLAIYLKDGRRIRVCAVSVINGIGLKYCDRARAQFAASLKESRRRR